MLLWVQSQTKMLNFPIQKVFTYMKTYYYIEFSSLENAIRGPVEFVMVNDKLGHDN